MKFTRKIAAGGLALAVLANLTACADMSPQTRNAAIGAGVGGVAGSVLTNGSTMGTVGGAAVGGVIGHQVK
jgi:osmotically inducible lipoprotein OsmB